MVKVNLAVVDNPDPFILLGQDVFGGPTSKCTVLGWNTRYNYLTVINNTTEEISNIYYLNNSDVVHLPTMMLKKETKPEKGVS